MAKILMVCLGNICRSPLAEGILRHKISEYHNVDSAGTANYHVGDSPDPRSILAAKQNGIDISNHKGRQFSKDDFNNFDLIYVMDNQNYKDVIKLADNETQQNKVKLILSELNSDLTEVPDPYYGSQKDFEFCYNLLNDACKKIAEKIS